MSKKISNTHYLTLAELLKIDDTEIVNILENKYGFTNIQIKLVGDILFEYAKKIGHNKDICNKAIKLYEYYQTNELKTIDFKILSRLSTLDIKLKSFLN